MDFWKILRITSYVALVLLLIGLFLVSGDQTQQQPSSTPQSSSSSDSGFGSIK